MPPEDRRSHPARKPRRSVIPERDIPSPPAMAAGKLLLGGVVVELLQKRLQSLGPLFQV